MKVRLYTGSLKLVERSGVGQAIHHQAAMLRDADLEVTERNEPDVDLVHFNTVFPDSFFAAILARLRGQTVIYYGHSTMEDFRNSFRFSNLAAPLFKRWIKLCYSMGDGIITPTDYSKRLLESYGIRKPIFALSNGVDTEKFSPSSSRRAAFRAKYGLAPGQKAVISVGLQIERKGILEFIELARRLPEVRFFWFGHTDLSLVPAEVAEAVRKAPANLTFPGFVDQDQLRDAYCGADLFCFMSHEETEGIVVLEALACGIPLLVRDIPVYEGWLQDGRNVYMASDLDGFEERTKAILSGEAPSLARASRATAERRSLRNTSRHLVQIYWALEMQKAQRAGKGYVK